MKIIAFLQNPWFNPHVHERHIQMYRDDPDFHRRVLARSATGRALVRALGQEIYDQILWDNANPRHGEKRDAQFPPDAAHMARRVIEFEPDVVLLFGRQAVSGWELVRHTYDCLSTRRPRVLASAHPMARGSVARHLEKIAAEVKKLCKS